MPTDDEGRRDEAEPAADGSADGAEPTDDGPTDGAEPTDAEVVEAASDAAEGLILSRYKQSDVRDFDVTVRFEDGVLDVDVYLNAPENPDADPDRVVEAAVAAAEAAVDELFEEA